MDPAAANAIASYQLYRRSSIGVALTDALDELIQNSLLDPQMAMRILSQFDASMSEALHSRVRARATLKGHLHVYRFCEDVWTFIIENPSFRMETGETVTADKIKLVACSVRNPAS